MKRLMTGNEAIARGFYEAGGTVASAYPGTPSTEILENISNYKNIYSEWAPNEKVATEVAIGASIAGARSLTAMKHVGLNVAADPLMTFGYTGVSGGFVLVSADDPGMHSSQNEQDNRYYGKFSKMAMIEPSDSQECKDFIKEAFKISEKFDTGVVFRVSTRICHSKSLVEMGLRKDVEIKPYLKNISKFITIPANAKKLHVIVENRLKKLEEFSNTTALNKIEWGNRDIGIITSGISYEYSKEVFGSNASYLKLGFTNPLPFEKIKKFAQEVKTLYVIEELEPYMEDQIKAKGIKCIGKERIPNVGELNPDIIASSILGINNKSEGEAASSMESLKREVISRPPTLCAGCPHRGLFYTLSRKKDIMITGDIGCYTLGCAEPLNAMDTCICMGSSISTSHGAEKAFKINGVDKKVVGVMGDSTFFHSGITGLIDIVYNKGNSVTIILDNRITAMTGHQQNPGTGYTLTGEKTNAIDIACLCSALGIKNMWTVNPLDLSETESALNKALEIDEPSVIITKWPCVLKKLSKEDKKQFNFNKTVYKVNEEKCKKCKMCIKSGCPAISVSNFSHIDEDICVGCSLCAQICPFHAIERAGDR
ncbi:indolepyruvate ferredoxin oxidoreductase subunit alpha [Clostridium sp. Mt-5]|uniref:Indolepyruvate oxidoreductase subunit IorA n=1 Tax=Clostridium moutaii TaxID=3240932 RepID=A0ABV4BN87_9CLOT